MLFLDQMPSFTVYSSQNGAFHVGLSIRAPVEIENQPNPVASGAGILHGLTHVGKNRIAVGPVCAICRNKSFRPALRRMVLRSVEFKWQAPEILIEERAVARQCAIQHIGS